MKDCNAQIRGDDIGKHFKTKANLLALDTAIEYQSTLEKSSTSGQVDPVYTETRVYLPLQSLLLGSAGGHSGNFKAGIFPGTILKKACGIEEENYKRLVKDELSSFTPVFHRMVVIEEENDDEHFIEHFIASAPLSPFLASWTAR